MLERRRAGQTGGLTQLVHQLPGSQRIEHVDVPRPAVEDAERCCGPCREQACRCLVRITAISESHLHTRLPFHRYPTSKRLQDAALAVWHRSTPGGENPMSLVS